MKAHYLTNKIFKFGLLAFSILMLTNCDRQMEIPVPFDLQNAQSEIDSRLRDYENAMAKGDKELFANLYAEDAEIFHDGRPSTIGRESIVENFDGWVRDSVIGGFETTGLWGNENLLVEQGTGYFAHAGGNWKATGKYLLVWKKVDGQWQIFRDSWFSDPEEEK